MVADGVADNWCRAIASSFDRVGKASVENRTQISEGFELSFGRMTCLPVYDRESNGGVYPPTQSDLKRRARARPAAQRVKCMAVLEAHFPRSFSISIRKVNKDVRGKRIRDNRQLFCSWTMLPRGVGERHAVQPMSVETRDEKWETPGELAQ